MGTFSIVVLAVTAFLVCVHSSSVTIPSEAAEPTYPTFVQSLNQQRTLHTRFLRAYESTGNDGEDRANLGTITGAIKSSASKVKENTKLKLWLASKKSGVDVLNALKLGDDVGAVLKSSKLEMLVKYADKFNKNKLPAKQISVIDTLIGKYGDDAVMKALASAKQADDTAVVTKLETELFTRWMADRKFPDNVFSTLKIGNQEDTVLRIGNIGLVDNYITFFNGKTGQKESLLKVLTKSFGDENKALSVLAAARENSPMTKRATELETKLLLEKTRDQMAVRGGLDALGKNLLKLDKYVTTLKTTYKNKDVSILGALLFKYSDATVAKALSNAKSVDEAKGMATKIQNEQFHMWLKDSKSIDDAYTLLNLKGYGDTLVTSRALDVLESYTAFFNREMGTKESFIKIISKHFGGDEEFAIKLLGLKGFETTSEQATKLQSKLFQQWKNEGATAENVITTIFKSAGATNDDKRRTAKEFKSFLENSA
ncbi:Avirulence (Avh) protein [Phytophthora megakarya]|uniref:Avirulence (Avh) protein n=1 Tax=Phytophthora megakarya TaxID=4795 RepID=A0A225VV46_9STRA|nr:Avirulence (Avh) protein [Phytophthora megakarya]